MRGRFLRSLSHTFLLKAVVTKRLSILNLPSCHSVSRLPQFLQKTLRRHFVSIGYANFTKVTKDFDENKENKTPEGTQGEVDWLQQYDMEREREEQELQQALAQSLQEQVRTSTLFMMIRDRLNISREEGEKNSPHFIIRHCMILFHNCKLRNLFL